MNRPSYLPKELDKKSLQWLRVYGYCLNSGDEEYKKIKENLQKFYPYEYYFYVDLSIKEKAEKELEDTNMYGVDKPNGYKGWTSHFRRVKKRLIKEYYGLDKKGIR